MNLRFGLGLVGVAALAALVWAQTSNNLSISVNGKNVAGKTLVSKGQTYIPLSALKAAGATAIVQNGTMAITFAPAAGGANQIAAVEGGLNEWLFNGIWRLRVNSVSATEDRPGWKVNVELRNGTKLDNVQLGGTGFDSLSLVMADGNAVKVYNITDIDRPVGQGGTIAVDLVFFDDEGNGRKPDKLILRIAPDKATTDFLKSMKVGYTVPDPSFRVKLPSS